MMPRYATFVLVIFIALAAGIGTARLAGHVTGRVPPLLAPGHCEQPCWHGLRPGEVTRDTFAAAIERAAPLSGRATGSDREVITRFEIITYGAIRLGDALRTLGRPERVGCIGYHHSTLFAGQPIVLAADLYFAGGLVAVNVVRPDDVPRLSPDMLVRRVTYYAPGEPAYAVGSTMPWRGFAAAGAGYRWCTH